MAKPKASDIEVRKFATHQVITQPNPLRKVLRRVDDKDADDPVARAAAGPRVSSFRAARELSDVGDVTG